jgi:hypothetical protein
VIAVVFNTIRLQVLTQRDEIAVSKLLGATDNFIHRPFYYTGALLGLCAGAVALGAVALALRPLNAAIAEFARLYASEFQLATLPPLGVAGLLAISAGLGLVGAMRQLKFCYPIRCWPEKSTAETGITPTKVSAPFHRPHSTWRITCLLPNSNNTSIPFEFYQRYHSHLLYSGIASRKSIPRSNTLAGLKDVVGDMVAASTHLKRVLILRLTTVRIP